MIDQPAGTNGRIGRQGGTLPGRRSGRRLRPGLRALLDRLLPRLALALPTEARGLDLKALFGGAPGPTWLEIGFGAGEHLAWQAKHNPEVGLLGAEVYLSGIAALLRAVDANALANVRIFQGDGRDLLTALPEASIDRAFLLYSDPWPKQRHHKRRLIQHETLDQLARVMNDGAELRIATDHGEYLRWILDKVTDHAGFAWQVAGPNDWRTRGADWPPTRYESKAIGQGRKPSYLRFRRCPRRRRAGSEVQVRPRDPIHSPGATPKGVPVGEKDLAERMPQA